MADLPALGRCPTVACIAGGKLPCRSDLGSGLLLNAGGVPDAVQPPHHARDGCQEGVDGVGRVGRVILWAMN